MVIKQITFAEAMKRIIEEKAVYVVNRGLNMIDIDSADNFKVGQIKSAEAFMYFEDEEFVPDATEEVVPVGKGLIGDYDIMNSERNEVIRKCREFLYRHNMSYSELCHKAHINNNTFASYRAGSQQTLRPDMRRALTDFMTNYSKETT